MAKYCRRCNKPKANDGYRYCHSCAEERAYEIAMANWEASLDYMEEGPY